MVMPAWFPIGFTAGCKVYFNWGVKLYFQEFTAHRLGLTLLWGLGFTVHCLLHSAA